MTINKDQLRGLITDVLDDFAVEANRSSISSDKAVELLMLTAAQESHLGTYIKQIKGPAKGIFQMEPNTEMDIWHNYLRFKPELRQAVTKFLCSSSGNDLVGNLVYQIVIARVHYMRHTEPIPSGPPEALAKYWKKYYNTVHGKGTVEEAVRNYTNLAT